MDKNRHFIRVDFHSDSKISCNGKEYSGELINLSLKGALLRFEKIPGFNKGDNCFLTIALSASDIILSFEVETVHLQNNDAGFKFTGIDIDSMTHLRRLIDLNADNNDITDEEIGYWLKD